MLITSYNPDVLGDTLIAVVAQDEASQTSKQAGDITVIKGESGKLLGINFFNVSEILGTINGRGQVFLDADQVAKLNAALSAAGFDDQLEADATPKFVIGVVTEFVAHPDSDHLHITQVDLGGYTKQIVCGAPNAALGQHVVAALPGAMMPDGKLIWPGALRGVDSYGMLCSARELALPNAPQKRGILVLPDSVPAGTPFDFDKAAAFLA